MSSHRAHVLRAPCWQEAPIARHAAIYPWARSRRKQSAHAPPGLAATASAADAELVTAPGARSVIDYNGAFEDQLADLDVVIDTVGGQTLARTWQVLRPGGILIGIAEPPSEEEAAAAGVRCAYFVVEPNRDQLVELAQLTDRGILHPAAGRVLGLVDACAAFTTPHGNSHATGKTVIRVKQPA